MDRIADALAGHLDDHAEGLVGWVDRDPPGVALARVAAALAGEFVYGMEPDVPLPDGWRPVGAVTVVRCLDADGQRRMLTVYAGDVMLWEALGMLAVAEDDVRGHLHRAPRIHGPG